jgi:pantoate--beta-alanine ligase
VIRVVETVAALREALGTTRPGLVPTMGALHEGHLALIRRSATENPLTAISIFVNPTQFSDPRDLAAYPRDLDRDLRLAVDAGADLAFVPGVDEIYPPGFASAVEVSGLDTRWEGEFRPGHFRGVATVVTVLFNAVRPGRAYFGEKDFQQLAIVRRFHRDLRLPGEIVGCPTVRDSDGLALSSRNVRLSPEERTRAAAIPAALFAMRSAAGSGETGADRLLEIGRTHLNGFAIDYLAVVDPGTLEPIETLAAPARALVAVRLGPIRLIDNLEIVPAGWE